MLPIHLEMWSKLRDGFVAVVIGLAAQLLIAGIQSILEESDVDFPPSILAMAGVFALLLTCGCFLPGVDGFYRRHLQGPANLLNRHMSIGFTIPFVMICRSELASPETIGLIILCFVLTGVFNTVLSYAFALPLQSLMSRWTYRSEAAEIADDDRKGKSEEKKQPSPGNLEKGRANLTVPSTHLSTSTMVSHLTSRSSTPAEKMLNDDAAAEETLPANRWTTTCHFILRNPMLILSWLLLVVVGLPLRYATQHDTFLATCLLSAIWFTTLAIQSGVKTSQHLRPSLRTLLSGLSNPVLWTSLAMIAYIFTDCAISSRSLPTMLDTLQTHNTLSELILRKAAGTIPGKDAMAAGDIALSILNAGLVSWGLKLYEYRRQLLSRAGLTVFSVSSLVALGNVALGPPFAHALSLGPAGRDLAFAARSVTLALGSPVLTTLGGDAGLNATMVVVSGIVFQMGLGFGAGAWLEGKVTGLVARWGVMEGSNDDPEAQSRLAGRTASTTTTTTSTSTDDPTTVAAGVTIGINAAAMGTAYLYEVKSDAAPYSALSMMALGIMTVVFSSIPPLAVWVVEQVSPAV
ncbi:hypothetical protein B0T14DRAFT_150292 [Immersiella caudata]|uniref:LrgB-like protein n=1 Tax=Immersiella caudata TaxID=314043 RepID=A0AA39WVX1_9PEZI|nr:hypothetical protein B0T14DRAFT_150292 [Immersiella caudata]